MGDHTDEGFALPLKIFLLGDITGNGRYSDNGAAAVLNGGNSDGNDQKDSILAYTPRFIGLYLLSPANALHDPGKFIMVILWEEEFDGLTDDLLGTVAIHTLCSTIPARDDTVQIFTQNSVIGRRNNSRGAKQSLFCSSSISDIADIALDDLMSIGLKQGTHPLNIAGLTVFSRKFQHFRAQWLILLYLL